MNFLATGSVGFIGSAFVGMLLAGEERVRADVAGPAGAGEAIAEKPDVVAPFAAESHADRPRHDRQDALSSAKLAQESVLTGEYRGYYKRRKSELGALLQSQRIRAEGAEV
jgi:dTDP-D-glucose 4,6-dehydratase